MRRAIIRNDDSLTAGKKTDAILSSGYRLLRKQADLKPSFYTVERGRSWLDILQSHIEMQQLCLRTLHKQELIKENEKVILDRELPYGNIRKAYKRMYKAYSGLSEITNIEDLRRYGRQADYTLEMQDAFIRLVRSNDAAGADTLLKRESNIEKIKLVIGL